MIGYNCTDRKFGYHMMVAWTTYFTRQEM